MCVLCASRKQLDGRRMQPHPSNQAIVVLTENLLFVGVCEWHQISVVCNPGYFIILLQVCVIDLLVVVVAAAIIIIIIVVVIFVFLTTSLLSI